MLEKYIHVIYSCDPCLDITATIVLENMEDAYSFLIHLFALGCFLSEYLVYS